MKLYIELQAHLSFNSVALDRIDKVLFIEYFETDTLFSGSVTNT